MALVRLNPSRASGAVIHCKESTFRILIPITTLHLSWVLDPLVFFWFQQLPSTWCIWRIQEIGGSFWKQCSRNANSSPNFLTFAFRLRRSLPLSILTCNLRLNSVSVLYTQLRKTPVDRLLQRHVEMAAEIKNLDSDMQMLVYENYNKFISATDTIRR
jgi:hypothetical protein